MTVQRCAVCCCCAVMIRDGILATERGFFIFYFFPSSVLDLMSMLYLYLSVYFGDLLALLHCVCSRIKMVRVWPFHPGLVISCPAALASAPA